MKTIIIDVREPHEYQTSHVRGAINIPPAILTKGMPDELADVSKDTQLIVYCLSGSRSNASIPYFKNLGFEKVVNGINQRHVESKLGV